MALYRVTHGALILDGVEHSLGAVVELTPEEAQRMDPAGECLAPVAVLAIAPQEFIP